MIHRVQKSIWELSMGYYKDNSKKVSKKRKVRLSAINQTIKNTPAASPLSNLANVSNPLLISAPPPAHGTISSNVSSNQQFNFSKALTTKGKKIVFILIVKGWNIRYDYKLAVFAEFRQDFHASIKLYEDAYTTLQDLMKIDILGNFPPSSPSFYSAAIPSPLQIEPLRWIEYKQFADYLVFKVKHQYLI